jgi:hypothetical protein
LVESASGATATEIPAKRNGSGNCTVKRGAAVGVIGMTEDEKRRVIADLLARAEAAERRGLSHTAKSWRDHALTVASRPSSGMILARLIGDFDISESSQ